MITRIGSINNAESYITQKLKEKFQGNNYLTRFLNDEQYPLTGSYINLVIVKQEEAKEKEKELDKKEEGKDKEFRDEWLSSYESLHQVSSPIKSENIFANEGSKEVGDFNPKGLKGVI